MLARTLIKLLDESILPAAIIVAAKVLGLALGNLVNNLPFTLQVGNSILPVTVVYNSAPEAQIANAFSNLVMYFVVLGAFLVVLFQAHFLHESHIPPKLSGTLVKMRLEHFIRGTFELYHQALVWLSFLWLVTLVIFIYAAVGGSISVALIAFLFSFISTYLYTKDVEIEIETERLLREAH